jgi:hypothetical protein
MITDAETLAAQRLVERVNAEAVQVRIERVCETLFTVFPVYQVLQVAQRMLTGKEID